MSNRAIADLPADVTLSAPELLAEGYCAYERYRLTLRTSDGDAVEQTRDIIRGGKVVAVLPVDLARDEIVLIRQFRMAAHLATGRGELIEIVAGGVDGDEQPAAAARRECVEEIGVSPAQIVPVFSYMTTPGLTDEEIVVFLASVDASKVPRRGGAPGEGEQIETMRVPIADAISALDTGALHNGPLIIALQWLALNRARIGELLNTKR